MDTDQTCPTCTRPLLPQDLPLHTLLCPPFTSLPPKPGGPSHILGLLFPPDSATSPTPTWIKLTTSTDDETSITFQSVDTSPIFPSSSSSPAPEVLYTERNTVRNRDTRSMLEIWALPPPGGDVGEEGGGNATVAALADRGREGPFRNWTGPVLALAMTRATGFMVDPGSYRDVDVEDAGDVVDFLLDCGNPEHARRVREALEMLGGQRHGDEREVEDAEVERSGEVSRGGDEEERDVVFEVL